MAGHPALVVAGTGKGHRHTGDPRFRGRREGTDEPDQRGEHGVSAACAVDVRALWWARQGAGRSHERALDRGAADVQCDHGASARHRQPLTTGERRHGQRHAWRTMMSDAGRWRREGPQRLRIHTSSASPPNPLSRNERTT